MLSTQCLIVILLVPAFLTGQSSAQITAILLPREQQSVCQGESLSFVCQSNGDVVSLYSPPIINESQAFSLTTSCESNPVFCTRRTPSSTATTTIVVDSADNSSLAGTINLYIPQDFRSGVYEVFCDASSQGTNIVNRSTFRVLERRLRTLELVITTSFLFLSERNMATVHISWSTLDDAERYVVAINGDTFNTNQTHITTVLTSDATFSGSIFVINSCEESHQNFTVQVPPQPPMKIGGALIGTIVAAVVGWILLLIVSIILIITCVKADDVCK